MDRGRFSPTAGRYRHCQPRQRRWRGRRRRRQGQTSSFDCSQYFLSAIFGIHGRQINTFILSINLYLLIFSRLLI
ncbi:hypothetical protein AHT65_15880, partial [Salmonella enterica subsp. enterica]|nr:hypothetical protein [Salmonella enterica subsp. enterica]